MFGVPCASRRHHPIGAPQATVGVALRDRSAWRDRSSPPNVLGLPSALESLSRLSEASARGTSQFTASLADETRGSMSLLVDPSLLDYRRPFCDFGVEVFLEVFCVTPDGLETKIR